MVILYLVLGVLVLSFIPVAILVLRAYRTNRRSRVVTCPETHGLATVRFDAGHAAFTAATGEPELRVRSCALWPGHGSCGQECTARTETA
jgi:hypothetical protein